jgi:hypothetical protein
VTEDQKNTVVALSSVALCVGMLAIYAVAAWYGYRQTGEKQQKIADVLASRNEAFDE